jgi:hypothetical protein
MRGRPPRHGHDRLRKDIKEAREAGKSLRKFLKDKKVKHGKDMDIS